MPHGGLDLRVLSKSTFTEREQFLELAERVALLTMPHVDPRAGGQGVHKSSIKERNVLQRIAANSFGAPAVKGLGAALNQTLNPAGIRFYKLDTDPSLTLTDAQRTELDKFFRREESRMAEWLSRHNFTAFSSVAIERVLIEGTEGVHIDPEEGFTLFRLNQLSIERSGQRVAWIIFEQFLTEPDPVDNTKSVVKSLYTYVNKKTGEVWSQMEDEDAPTLLNGMHFDEETGELVEVKEDNPRFWFVFGTEVPQFHNFGVAFYMNHLSLLEDIEDMSLSLKNAQRIAGQFFYTLDPTGVGEITPQRFQRIKNHEVIPMAHDKVKPWTTGLKLQDWSFIATRLQESGRRLLDLSAVGLIGRKASIRTATEVRALRAELEMLIGSTANVLARTFHFQIVEALIDVLEIRERLAADPALEGVEKDTMDKLVRAIVVTGSPEIARERELEKLQDAVEHSLALFGEKALQEFNVRGYMETVFDSLNLETSNVLVTQEISEERNQPQPQPQPAAPLPGQNGQLNQSSDQLAQLRAGAVL